MRTKAKMIVKGGVCTTASDVMSESFVLSVYSAYYLRAAGMKGGEIIVAVNSRGD
jgi:hypothetical protein